MMISENEVIRIITRKSIITINMSTRMKISKVTPMVSGSLNDL